MFVGWSEKRVSGGNAVKFDKHELLVEAFLLLTRYVRVYLQTTVVYISKNNNVFMSPLLLNGTSVCMCVCFKADCTAPSFSIFGQRALPPWGDLKHERKILCRPPTCWLPTLLLLLSFLNCEIDHGVGRSKTWAPE